MKKFSRWESGCGGVLIISIHAIIVTISLKYLIQFIFSRLIYAVERGMECRLLWVHIAK